MMHALTSSSLTPIVLGAPGVYRVAKNPIQKLTGVRMDVCAFVGVAPRGPARDPYFSERWAPKPCAEGETVKLGTPVALESWSEYGRLFGYFEGPGLLPYAVASFFENGGRRAYIVRIVHQYFKPDRSPDDAVNNAGVARAPFAGITASGGREVWVRARNEGSWGNRLSARLSFISRALALTAADFFPDRIRLPIGLNIVAGTTLRLFLGSGVKIIRRVGTVIDEWNQLDGSRERWAWFDAPAASVPSGAEILEGVLAIDDGVNPTETHSGLGLSSNHPRWLAAVLVNESELIYPCDDPNKTPADPLAYWLDSDLQIAANLTPLATGEFTGGLDRYADIVPEDFFDPDWVVGDDCPGSGIHSLTELEDLSLLVVPDIYSPGPLTPSESIVQPSGLSGPEFAECVEPIPSLTQAQPAQDLTGLRLDPRQNLDQIALLQRRVTDLADQLKSFIVLLDVPPGVSQRQILYWRTKFDSAYAAAYFPWLGVARTDDNRRALISVNPAAVAAGILAQREAQFGVVYGPGNVIAAGAVTVDDRVSAARHDQLHQSAINVYIAERDGILLTAARTLALDQTWRQLNVRRLVTMIRRVLEKQMQWTVFEPNNRQLRFQIARMLEAFLRQLYRANAFTGATEAQAFFVRCDDNLNPPLVERSGQLIAQVGIAPAEPLEFIVLNIARNGDSTSTVEAA
jgi:Bacteriophage tail sheath protein